MKIIIGFVVGLLVTCTFCVFYLVLNEMEQEPSFGSVSQEYNYTHYSGSGIASTSALKTGWGTFGSVIITEDQAGEVIMYDATSTEALAGDSSLYDEIATFEDAQEEGVYTFDVIFNKGLVFSGAGQTFAGNWTITYR